VSPSSRERSAALISERLAILAPDLPVLVAGDLNASASSPAVRTLRGELAPGGLQLADAYRAVTPPAPQEATFHDFTGDPDGVRIDHVLASDAFTPQSRPSRPPSSAPPSRRTWGSASPPGDAGEHSPSRAGVRTSVARGRGGAPFPAHRPGAAADEVADGGG